MPLMRVIWINQSHWLKPGPQVYVAVHNALAFAGQARSVHLLIGRNRQDPAPEVRSDLENFYGIQPPGNLHVETVQPAARAVKWLHRPLIGRLAGLLSGSEPVLLLTRETSLLPALVRLRARHRQMRVLYEAHDLYADPAHRPHPSLRDRLRGRCERSALPRLDGLICLTPDQQSRYLCLLPGVPSLVAPLSVWPHPPASVVETRRNLRRAVYIGHLHPDKGVGIFADLARELAKRQIALSLIGGSAAQAEQLKIAIQSSSPVPGLEVDPFLSPAQMHARLHDRVSVGLAPYAATVHNRFLANPVKVLDYLAHGLPMVASDLESIRLLAGSDASLLAADAPAFRWAHAAAGLIDDAARYEDTTRRLSCRAEKHTWSRRAENILQWVTERAPWQP